MNALDESGAMFPANALPEQDTKLLTAQMHALNIGAALRKLDALQCVRYKIGGVDETTVGYMHFGASCTKPVMGTEDVDVHGARRAGLVRVPDGVRRTSNGESSVHRFFGSTPVTDSHCSRSPVRTC